jgi:hypothetical protein
MPNRSSARNTMCLAHGLAIAIINISDFDKFTAEEHKATIETAVLLKKTIVQAIKEIQAMELEAFQKKDQAVETANHLRSWRENNLGSLCPVAYATLGNIINEIEINNL